MILFNFRVFVTRFTNDSDRFLSDRDNDGECKVCSITKPIQRDWLSGVFLHVLNFDFFKENTVESTSTEIILKHVRDGGTKNKNNLSRREKWNL